MAPEYARQDDIVVRSLARRLTGFVGLAVLIIVALAMTHGVLDDGAVIALALAGVCATATAGAWVARCTSDAFRAKTMELERLAGQMSGIEATVDAARRRALNEMADKVERESGVVMARLAQQAKAKPGAIDVDALLRLAREGVVRAVRSASGDVERRRWPRLRLTGAAEIQLAAGRASVPIIEVSAGGMRVGDGLAAAIGETCRVRLPGVGPELPARILAVSTKDARLSFEIDEITRAVVSRILESAARERAEAA